MILLSTALLAGCQRGRDDGRVGVLAKDPGEYMFVGAAGQKAWNSARDLDQTARNYAADRKVKFSFDGTEKNIWVNTDGGAVLAEVYYSSGMGQPVLHVTIDRHGRATTHDIAIGVCGTGMK